MSADTAKAIIAHIVATLIQNDGEHPSGYIYAGLMPQVSLDSYNKVLGIGQDLELWTLTSSHLLKLGPKGQELASEVSSVVSR